MTRKAKKLFSLIAVLALVLTLVPAVSVGAQEQSLPSLTVTASPSAVFINADATITLSLTDYAGQPLAEGVQAIVSVDSLGFAVTATTATGGLLVVVIPQSKLAEGTYEGTVAVNGFASGTFTFAVAGKQLMTAPTSATLSFGQEVTTTFTLEDETGSVVPEGVQALLALPKGSAIVSVGTDGLATFTLTPDQLMIGSCTAILSVEGYADAAIAVSIIPGTLVLAPASFDVSFAKTVTLPFKVIEESSSTMLPEGTNVKFIMKDYEDTVTVGKDGTATITLEPEQLKIGETMQSTIKVDGYNDVLLPINVKPGTLTLDPSTLIVSGTEDIAFTVTLMDSASNDVPYMLKEDQLVATLTFGSVVATASVGKNSKTTFTLTASAMEQLGGGTFTGTLSLFGFNDTPFSLTISDLSEKTPTVPTQPTATPITIEFVVGSNTFIVNGQLQNMDVAPFVRNGRAMVPIRFLAEAMGFTVDYDFANAAAKTVSIHGPKEIILTIGSTTAKVDGMNVELDAVPEISMGRTMVPARFVGETFGLSVNWAEGVVTLTNVTTEAE